MQEDPSEYRSEKKRFTRYMPGWPLALTVFAIAIACALYVHEREISGGWMFVGVTLLTSAALWFMTFMLDSWFGRPTNGTSGAIGMAMIWCVVRAVVMLALMAGGLAGLWSYVGTYMAVIIVCGVIDTIFIVISL